MWGSWQKRIFAYHRPVDMRRSFDGLIAAVRDSMQADPLTGDLYVFINKRGTLLKGIFWDRTGWCLFAKRLERGRFEVRHLDMSRELSSREFSFLLDGILRNTVMSRHTGCAISNL